MECSVVTTHIRNIYNLKRIKRRATKGWTNDDSFSRTLIVILKREMVHIFLKVNKERIARITQRYSLSHSKSSNLRQRELRSLRQPRTQFVGMYENPKQQNEITETTIFLLEVLCTYARHDHLAAAFHMKSRLRFKYMGIKIPHPPTEGLLLSHSLPTGRERFLFQLP